jgi:hypothetical protein
MNDGVLVFSYAWLAVVAAFGLTLMAVSIKYDRVPGDQKP